MVTGTSEPPEDSDWAFTFSPRGCRMPWQISARTQLHKDATGAGDSRGEAGLALLPARPACKSHLTIWQQQEFVDLGAQLGSLTMPSFLLKPDTTLLPP